MTRVVTLVPVHNQDNFCVDQRRLYITGMSVGAMMGLQIATTHASIIAGAVLAAPGVRMCGVHCAFVFCLLVCLFVCLFACLLVQVSLFTRRLLELAKNVDHLTRIFLLAEVLFVVTTMCVRVWASTKCGSPDGLN
jgi:MFS family permease